MGCRKHAPDMSSLCGEQFIFLQHGHLGALMTIDLEVMCGAAVPKSMLMIDFA